MFLPKTNLKSGAKSGQKWFKSSFEPLLARFGSRFEISFRQKRHQKPVQKQKMIKSWFRAIGNAINMTQNKYNILGTRLDRWNNSHKKCWHFFKLVISLIFPSEHGLLVWTSRCVEEPGELGNFGNIMICYQLWEAVTFFYWTDFKNFGCFLKMMIQFVHFCSLSYSDYVWGTLPCLSLGKNFENFQNFQNPHVHHPS